MTIHVSLGGLLGIIIGALSIALILAVSTIIITQRIKHRRLMAQTYAAGERRLSRYPGGNVSITDEDVARIPGIGTSVRNILQTPSKPPPIYLPMSLHYDIEKSAHVDGPLIKSQLSRTPSQQRMIEACLPPPRRLKRVNGHPMIELQCAPPTCIGETSDHSDQPDEQQSRRRARRIDAPGDRHSAVSIAKPGSKNYGELKPKPLFHEKSRSISHGTLLRDVEDQKLDGSYLNLDLPKKIEMPRSTSLCSQEASLPPLQPAPSLPPEALALSRHRSLIGARSSLRYSDSGQRLGVGAERRSGSSSEKHRPRTLDPAKTVATSMTVAPSRTCSNLDLTDQKGSDTVRHQAHDAMGFESIHTLQNVHDAHKPSEKDVCQILPQNASETLSALESGKKDSQTTATREPARVKSDIQMPSKNSKAPHISLFDFNMLAATEKAKTEHARSSEQASASTSQVFSRNEQVSFGPSLQQPLSITFEYKLQRGDNNTTAPIAAKIFKGAGSERVDLRSVSSSPNLKLNRPLTKRGGKDLCQPNNSTYKSPHKPRVEAPILRPPSRSTFDPAVPTSLRKSSSSPYTGSSYSRTFATLSGDTSFESSPTSDVSTPTRKPSRSRVFSSKSHHQKPRFDDTAMVQWPLSGQQRPKFAGFEGSSLEAKSSSLQTGGRDQACEDVKRKCGGAAYSSHILPSPCLTDCSDKLGPLISKDSKRPSLRGPRTPPKSRHQSRYRKSPIRSIMPSTGAPPNSTATRSSPDLAVNGLRQSIMALRRMDSSITQHSLPSPGRMNAGKDASVKNRGHRQYFSLPERESCIFESTNDDDPNSIEARLQALMTAESQGRRARRRRRGSSVDQAAINRGDDSQMARKPQQVAGPDQISKRPANTGTNGIKDAGSNTTAAESQVISTEFNPDSRAGMTCRKDMSTNPN